MVVCRTAGASVSLLPGSNAAGGEDDAQGEDDSSLPIWSRKLQKPKKVSRLWFNPNYLQ